MSDVAEVLNASRDRFLSFLTRRVESRDTAEEILQTALMKIVAKGAAPRDEERVEAWFYRILRNEVVDHYRRRGAEARSLEALARGGGSETDLDRDLDRAICACVRDVIPTLKPEYADILKRADLEEGSLTEVARHLGLTANNATVRLHRARAALRERLGEVCGACTKHGCLSCACRPKKGSRSGTVPRAH